MSKEITPNVGVRLRTLRERQGWSLRALAERCGLSINAISRIERGENSPTITSLHRLATALSVPITDFFMEFPRQAAFYIKRGDGWQIQREGFQVEHLGPVPDGGQLEPFLITILPGNEYDSSPVSHPGEEFIYCLQGEIEYCLGENSYYLSPGDSLLFQAMHPHNWRNMSAKPAVLLLVFQAAQDNSLARQRHRTG